MRTLIIVIVLRSNSFALPMYLDSFVLQTRVKPGTSKVEIKRYGRETKFGFFITNVIAGMGQISEGPLFVKHVNIIFNFSIFESRFSNLFTGFKVVVLYDKKIYFHLH